MTFLIAIAIIVLFIFILFLINGKKAIYNLVKKDKLNGRHDDVIDFCNAGIYLYKYDFIFYKNAIEACFECKYYEKVISVSNKLKKNIPEKCIYADDCIKKAMLLKQSSSGVNDEN